MSSVWLLCVCGGGLTWSQCLNKMMMMIMMIRTTFEELIENIYIYIYLVRS